MTDLTVGGRWFLTVGTNSTGLGLKSLRPMQVSIATQTSIAGPEARQMLDVVVFF